MGPQHPSTHGVLRIELKLDGEVVVDSTPHIGYLHRSIEKIVENRTYLQVTPFTDRMDYLASMFNNLSYAMAVEKIANIEVPPRGQYIRTIIVELNRIASHLVGVGTFAQDLGAFATPLFYCFREREKIMDLFESTCGTRLTYNYIRFGGVSQDLPPDFISGTRKFIKYMRPKLNDFEMLLTRNVILLARTKGIGVLTKDVAIDYAVTGPNLRGSDVKWDLRKEEPYLAYKDLDFDVPTGKNGDVWDRYKVRIEEIRQSLRIVEQALDKLPEGECNAKVAKFFKPPVGEAYSRIESPRGELGFYVVSDGTAKPYRVKARVPSFSNLAVVPYLIKGVKIADIVAILGSIDVVMGEIDR